VLANQKADWLVVDHYALDRSWEVQLKPHCKKILVIDDLADRPHDCDVLLDQNLRQDGAARYRGLVPATCRLLLGPAHVLLAPAFDAPWPRARVGELRSALVYFGGNDRCNQAGRAVEALAHFPQIKVEVVLGSAHPFRDKVMAQASLHQQMRVRDTCSDMAGAMCQADFGLGTCGMAAWERCAVGLPSLVTVSADNQREDALALAALGAVQHLGEAAEVSVDAWIAAIGRFMAAKKQAVHMAEAARAVVVGHTENRRRLVDMLVGRYAE
jgi:UDP-2,4-diacetamido-2,4,6-trideoxy-beta-L-altropyranose hydrolase